ncbi:hypothetical protein R3X27_25460, partial [Tropicimonas sp. TH_r6]|uniref:hypothetical protein n=1 Tax=Tropicimonas sp. TH_r6 TaxID=3082085 RepID=UPI002952BF86
VGDAAAFRIEYRHWPGDFRSEIERERFEGKEQWEWPTTYETLDEISADLSKEIEALKGYNRNLIHSNVHEMTKDKGWRTLAIVLLIPYLLAGAFFIYFG